MNGEDMLRTMSYVDQELIVKAEKRPRKKAVIFGIGSAAAAAAVALAVGVNVLRSGTDIPFEYPDLPVLSYGDNFNGEGQGLGREAYEAKDISEIKPDIPWREDMNIKSLPVFRSCSKAADGEDMRAHLTLVAEMFGIDISDFELHEEVFDPESWKLTEESFRKLGAPDEELERMKSTIYSMSSIDASSEGTSIGINSIFDVNIRFEFKDGLPESLRTENKTEGETAGAGEYFAEEYKDALEKLGITDPVIAIEGTERDKVKIYNRGSSDEETLINYYFNYASFRVSEITDDAPNNAGILYISVRTLTGAERLDSYPIITAEQAEELLFKGQCLPKGTFENGETAARVELCYRVQIGTSYHMPFYRFLVETPEGSPNFNVFEEGNKCFIAYYVPAVDGRYLEDMPAEYIFN